MGQRESAQDSDVSLYNIIVRNLKMVVAIWLVNSYTHKNMHIHSNRKKIFNKGTQTLLQLQNCEHNLPL